MAQQNRFSAAQLRAARTFLNWSVRELSEHSGVSQSSISRAERAKTGRGMSKQNVNALKATFERFGIHFLGGYGLKWADGQEHNAGGSLPEWRRLSERTERSRTIAGQLPE